MKIFPLKVSFFIMGMSGITAQVLLLRELLVSFLGNELTLGIILANWLILVAIGSFLIGKSAERVQRRIEVFVILQLVFSVAFPFVLFLSRVFKNMLLTTPGEALGFAPIWYSSFSILLPVTLPYGALFTYGCKLYSHYSLEDAASVGRVYLFETVGSIIGGLALTFFLIQYFSPFAIAFLISWLNTFMSMILVWPALLQKGAASASGSSNHPFRIFLWVLSGLLCFVLAYSLLSPIARGIDQLSIRSQWINLNVIHHENSIYGNMTVAKSGEQFTFFNDGIPSITTPVPDISFVEDFVHFPMLFHENPKSILVLSGGAGGVLHEILKYPVNRLDYVELDPLLLKLIQKFSTPLTQSELSDQRVKIHSRDGRLFTRQTQAQFDILFIGHSAPQSLQTNRLFSLEFFTLAKKKMKPKGILVLMLPGSLTYISPELKDLNGCLLDTLKSVFPYVRIIPGNVNLYLASDSVSIEKISSDGMIKRFEERKIPTRLITKKYIEYRLHERWLKWFWESMGERKTHLNSDFRPMGVFYNLSYWNALFSPYLIGIFKWFEGFHFPLLIAKILLLTFILSLFFIKRPHHARQAIPYSLFTTGLTGMIFSLAIIFAFQTLYGYLYHQIGLLIAIFMFGIASGSFLITNRLHRIRQGSFLFLKIEIGIVFFAILFPYLFLIPSHFFQDKVVTLIHYSAILILSFINGGFIGLQFPLAAKLFLAHCPQKEGLGQTAGYLYGADLFGGFFGGLLGGVFFLPVLGLKETCFMMAVLKISSGLLFLLFIKIRKTQ